MTRQEKLLRKLLDMNAVLTWSELVTILRGLGYQVQQGPGSRVKFVHEDPLMLISLHKPHPGNELKRYARLQVIEKLKSGELL